MFALVIQPEVGLMLWPVVALAAVVIGLKALEGKRFVEDAPTVVDSGFVGDWAYKIYVYPRHPAHMKPWGGRIFGYEILHRGEFVDLRERAYTTRFQARSAALAKIAELSGQG